MLMNKVGNVQENGRIHREFFQLICKNDTLHKGRCDG